MRALPMPIFRLSALPNKETYLFVLVVVFYLFLILVLPASKTVMYQYRLDSVGYRSLLLTLAIPSIIVWGIGLYGVQQLTLYAQRLIGTARGYAFDRMALAMRILVWSLPVTAIFSSLVLAAGISYPALLKVSVIVLNYTLLGFALVSFSLLSGGTRALLLEHKFTMTSAAARVISLLFVVLGSLYCFFVFRNLNTDSLTAIQGPYFLPTWLVVLTLLIPFLYAWFCGLLAAFELHHISRMSEGVWYRQALVWLAAGITLVIAGGTSAQYIQTINPQAGYFSVNWLLALSTFIRVITGAGFAVLAIGAKKLQQLEEA